MHKSSFPWKEWLLFFGLIGLVALAIVPGLYLMGQHDMDPQEYEKNISHLLGVQEDVAISLDDGALAKADELELNQVSFANAIMASKWAEEHFGKKVSVGILYAIDMAEWRGGGYPGDCDGLKSAMGNPRVNSAAQEKAVNEILAHWKTYNVRLEELAFKQIYPGYGGYFGGCSTGEIGSGYIPETALRVMKMLESTGDPTVADWNLWRRTTSAKATAYEIGRMCPDGVTVTCLFGWNQDQAYRQRLFAAASKMDSSLSGSELATWSDNVYIGVGDDKFWKKAFVAYLDLWGITPKGVKSAPDFAPFNMANGEALYFLYGHMDTISVTPGQTVKKGELIGTCGETGNGTGPHLHFGASDLSPDKFTTYLQFNPGWFDPKKVLGQPNFLASPVSLEKPLDLEYIKTVGQDWMNIHADLNPAGHPGLDIPCGIGTPLYAVADATVVNTTNGNWTSGFGNRVILAVQFESPSSPNSIQASGGWANPYPGSHVCGNPYGKVYETGIHTGIDLCNGQKPNWVYAMHSGEVVYAEFLERKTSLAAEWWVSGNTVAIKGVTADGRSIWTCYGHGSDNSFQVKVGDHVNAGDPIMLSGNTGFSAGVHVHLCMKIDDSWINPTQYFNLINTQ